MKNKIIITPYQCKAARELLRWNQKDLSRISKIGTATLANFEKDKIELRIGTLEKIISAFHEHGIRFENNENEFAVRLLKKNK